MNLSPIFGLYPDTQGDAQAALEQAATAITPVVATDHLGVVHRMWPVTDHDTINRVRELLREKPIFIADGHHRYETALNYRDYLASEGKLAGDDAAANFVLMMFVGMSDPGLAILPTHRLVSGLPDLTADDVRAALEKHFEIETIGTGPEGARETWELIEADGEQNVLGFGTTADGQWLLARVTDASPMKTLAPDQSDAWRALGVSLLHRLAIDHLIGGRYPDASPKFKYVHLLDEVNEGQQTKSCQLACLVPPAQISDVEEIASHFEKMPPKSTYFYPKLHSGLVFNSLE